MFFTIKTIIVEKHDNKTLLKNDGLQREKMGKRETTMPMIKEKKRVKKPYLHGIPHIYGGPWMLMEVRYS